MTQVINEQYSSAVIKVLPNKAEGYEINVPKDLADDWYICIQPSDDFFRVLLSSSINRAASFLYKIENGHISQNSILRSYDGTTFSNLQDPARWLPLALAGECIGCSGTKITLYIYVSRPVTTQGSGYLINHAGGYPIGTTTVAVDTGAGAITNGSYVFFAGDPVAHTVISTVGGGAVTSITFTPALSAAIADNAAVTVVDNPPQDTFPFNITISKGRPKNRYKTTYHSFVVGAAGTGIPFNAKRFKLNVISGINNDTSDLSNTSQSDPANSQLWNIGLGPFFGAEHFTFDAAGGIADLPVSTGWIPILPRCLGLKFTNAIIIDPTPLKVAIEWEIFE